MKKTVLSVRLKGRHGRGSAPMSMPLDLRPMPLEDNAAAQAQLLSWSDSDIEWLVQAKFQELDTMSLKN